MAKARKTAGKAARKSKSAKDAFEKIDERIREEFTIKHAVARFAALEAASLLNTYEQGGIVSFAKNLFGKDKARFESFVLNNLRIDLGRAGRLMRIHRGIQRSGRPAAEFEGISESSLLLMSPVMNSTNNSERGALPELMKLAQTEPVATVKEAVYKARRINSEKFGKTFFYKSYKSLHALGKKFALKDHAFAFVIVSPDGKFSGLSYCNIHERAIEFNKMWNKAMTEMKSTGFVPTTASESKGAAKKSAAPKAPKSRKAARKSETPMADRVAEIDQNEIDFGDEEDAA